MINSIIEEINKDEKLIIARMAGCDIETYFDGNKITIKTKYPVAITELGDGIIHVTELINEEIHYKAILIRNLVC